MYKKLLCAALLAGATFFTLGAEAADAQMGRDVFSQPAVQTYGLIDVNLGGSKDKDRKEVKPAPKQEPKKDNKAPEQKNHQPGNKAPEQQKHQQNNNAPEQQKQAPHNAPRK